MAINEFQLFQEQSRSEWVRLRTLVMLRWIAIAGQSIAVIVSYQFYGLRFEIGLTAMVIGAAIIANLFSTFLYPENKRLSGQEAFFMMGFDIMQLGLLLALTGGLHNPFALLMLAPVTIAATALRLQSTMILGALSLIVTTMLSQFYLPLYSGVGLPLILPPLFRFGFWLALVIGIVFIAIYTRQVTNEMQTMGDALVATQLALSREQKLTDLGGVVAAAAHELGTPLATIKLVSSELMEELEDNQDLFDDALLIRDQADRCRDILRSMGRAGKDDQHLKQAPLETVIREAAEPHEDRGKTILYEALPDELDDQPYPQIYRRPEIIHGIRNLIQNAVDFAHDTVLIQFDWTPDTITVRILDDGDGFSPSVISRIGDPFMRKRRSGENRPGYEGMGLGLFIAKTLLERSGANLRFSNGADTDHHGGKSGAIVHVEWPRAQVDPGQARDIGALGENNLIQE